MSEGLDQLRTRQDQFDTRLGTLERTVETQATLRAAMEKDIADVQAEQRAQRALLQAVHDTQSEHTKRFRSVETRLGNVETRLGSVETRLGSVEGRLGQVEGRLGQVEGRLGQVEEKLGNVHIGVQAILAVLDRKIDEEEPGQ
jgi:chromosome segregation ATPase